MKFLIFVTVITLHLSCAQKNNTEKSWPNSMQELAATLTDLLPYVFNGDSFERAENKKMVRHKIEEFYAASHVIPMEKAGEILGKDPLVNVSINNLKTEVASALEAFDRGNMRYSRHLLQHTLNYCFACHTRTHFGPKYDFWNLKSLANVQVNPIQRSQIMVATRQFDRAKDVLKSHLTTKDEADDNSYFQEQAIKQYLSIVVRAEEKPEEGYKFINEFVSRKNLSTSLEENIKSWESSLVDWMTDDKSKQKKSLSSAIKLIDQSDLLHAGADSESKYVDYLRASSILHEVLSAKIKNRERAEAYYYLGVIYNLLSEAGFWELPEKYFEACVRQVPKSKLSKKCYSSYEQNVIVGYSGSGGTFIPADERKRMVELKKISEYK